MTTVLVVDDEPSMRKALRAFLERAGFAVVEADSSAAALRRFSQGPGADAVVCDVLMPGESGIAFYDALLEHSPALANRVVFLTGAASDPRVHAPIEQRGVPLISKIDDLRLVVDAVRLSLVRRPSMVAKTPQ